MCTRAHWLAFDFSKSFVQLKYNSLAIIAELFQDYPCILQRKKNIEKYSNVYHKKTVKLLI